MRNGNHDGVDLRLLQKLFGVREQLQSGTDSLVDAVECFGINITDSRQFAVFQVVDIDDMCAAHVADADNAEFHFFHGKRLLFSSFKVEHVIPYNTAAPRKSKTERKLFQAKSYMLPPYQNKTESLLLRNRAVLQGSNLSSCIISNNPPETPSAFS